MTQRIEITHNNEFSRLSGHINSLADNLHDILLKLNQASDDLTLNSKSEPIDLTRRAIAIEQPTRTNR